MAVSTNPDVKRDRDVFYYRQRYKNRVFETILDFFNQEIERSGITKKDIARRLKRDPAQITRWLSSPGNLTLETISDLLLALDAEADPGRIVRFSERSKPNYAHPLIAKLIGIGAINPAAPKAPPPPPPAPKSERQPPTPALDVQASDQKENNRKQLVGAA